MKNLHFAIFFILALFGDSCKKEQDLSDDPNAWHLEQTGIWNGNNAPDDRLKSIISRNDTVFAGTKSGSILFSNDNGLHWTRLQTGLEGYEISLFFVEDKILARSEINYGTLYISSDFCKSWQPIHFVNNSPVYSYDEILILHSKIFVGTSVGYSLQVSEDYGQTWHNSNSGIQESDILSLYKYGDDMYVTTDDGVGSGPGDFGIYHSNDLGVTWTSIQNNLIYGPHNCLFVDSLYIYCGFNGFTDRRLKTNPIWQSNYLPYTYICEYDNIKYFINEGIISPSVNNGFSFYNHFGFQYDICNAFYKVGSNLIAGFNINGTYLSSDNGYTWHYQKTFEQKISSLIASGNEMFTCNDYGDIFKSVDGGQSWLFKYHFGANGILSQAGDDVYLCTNIPSCINVLKAGNNFWTTIANNVFADKFIGIAASGSTVIACSETSAKASGNGGVTWYQLTPYYGLPLGISINSIKYVHPYFYIGTNGQGIYRSPDCYIWKLFNKGVENRKVFTFAGYRNETFLSCDDGVYRCPQNDSTWIKASSGLPQSSSFLKMVSDYKRVYAFSPTKGVYFSIDSCRHWSPCNNGLNTNFAFSDIAIGNSKVFLVGNAILSKPLD